MPTLTIPYSGRLLVAHLAAYGLAFVLDADGEDAFVGNHPDSLEMEPQISTPASLERVATCVRTSAAECEAPIEADLLPGKTGNERRPAVWSRMTKMDSAVAALRARERVLDEAEHSDNRIVAGVLAGLGAPGAWLNEGPQRGASRFDGVIGNHTSDFVRGVMRRTRPAALEAGSAELAAAWIAGEHPAPTTQDRTGWSPPGTAVDFLHQWLAALGLSQLPVGLASGRRALTPCHWSEDGLRYVTLPVMDSPVSMPRLRALLQTPELVQRTYPSTAARLRTLGVRELVTFAVIDRSTSQSTCFSFARATYTRL